MYRSLKTWDYYIDRVSDFEMEILENDVRLRCLSALRVLRTELGIGFLKTCDRNHPISIMVQNASSGSIWAIEKVIKFSETILQLKENETSYRKLLGKLNSSNKCRQEGLPFCEVAEMFLSIGYKVSFPDEVHGFKNPDIEVYVPATHETFYIEVSRLDENDTVKASQSSYCNFLSAFPFLDIPYSCYQMRNFGPSEISHVLNTINAQRSLTMSFDKITFYEDENIKLAMAPAETRQQFDEWCIANEMRSGVHGVSLSFNETDRIASNKLGKECRQISADKCGIIIIPSSPLYFYEIDLATTVQSFQRKLSNYLNILGVIVYADILDASLSTEIKQDYYSYSSKSRHGVFCRKLLFVRNPAFRNLLSVSTQYDIQLVS